MMRDLRVNYRVRTVVKVRSENDEPLFQVVCYGLTLPDVVERTESGDGIVGARAVAYRLHLRGHKTGKLRQGHDNHDFRPLTQKYGMKR